MRNDLYKGLINNGQRDKELRKFTWPKDIHNCLVLEKFRSPFTAEKNLHWKNPVLHSKHLLSNIEQLL